MLMKSDGAAAGADDNDEVTCSVIAVDEWVSFYECNTYNFF